MRSKCSRVYFVTRAEAAAVLTADGTGELDGNEQQAENEKSLDARKTRVLPSGGVGDTGLEPVTSAV
jgi:hypothetical protein